MSRLMRSFAVLLVALIVSPFTVPLSSCGLADLLAPPSVGSDRADDGSPVLVNVKLHVLVADESRRIKDDAHWHHALPVMASATVTAATERLLPHHRVPARASRTVILRI